MTSRRCRSTSSFAVRTQLGGSWISLASQYHVMCPHTHTRRSYVLILVCLRLQVQRLLPHVLLLERPVLSTELRERGPSPRDDPRQGGEQTGEADNGSFPYYIILAEEICSNICVVLQPSRLKAQLSLAWSLNRLHHWCCLLSRLCQINVLSMSTLSHALILY